MEAMTRFGGFLIAVGISLILTLLVAVLATSCKSLKLRDAFYQDTQKIETISAENTKSVYPLSGGCSCVAIGYKEGYTYLVSAQHCLHLSNPLVVQGLIVDKTWADVSHDIFFFRAHGKLNCAKVLKERLDYTDITVGWRDSEMVQLPHRAVPGQSGGAVFSGNQGVWGIVSTTGEGVAIYPALERMGLLWILEKN